MGNETAGDAAKESKQKPGHLKDSAWTRLRLETDQDYRQRQPMIQKIEDTFGCRTYVFFTSFEDRRSTYAICNADAEMMENVLLAEHDGGPMILIINSPGGDGLAAERIANICRAYSGNRFSVLVPHMAKSAATLIAFGADKILMSKTSELGPVDPQEPYIDDSNEVSWISVAEYVRAYDKLIEMGRSDKTAHIEPIIQQLVRFDARHVEQLRSSQELAVDISIGLLETGMLKGTDRDKIRKLIEPFWVQEEKSSHGRMITYDEANRCGLKAELIPLEGELWPRVWELYLRTDWVVKYRCAALLETAKSCVTRIV